ncbi:taspase, threonine aspartase, 1 [Phytophthora pseudosyringae]|uniref:Taspase, threonine aspartase, 1 n=1 Tax=Phytophthora pseudosyringae TaxID=221518 RepID=A0A8T1V9Z4_9STRA|nr:taspase, threonine aspartase, 1 [Phytophthora pseudosyringae]
MSDWLLAVHCGAGRYGSSSEAAYLSLLRSVLEGTHQVLRSARCPPTAAQTAAHLLHAFERSSLTNAGLGANLTEEGRVECEASVVCGHTHLVSCCGAVRGVQEPSALALKLLEQAQAVDGGDASAMFAFGRQPPLVVVGEHARQLARGFGLETATEEDEALRKFQVTETTQERWDKWRGRFQEAAETKEEQVEDERFDTVGAICMDPRGNVAAALSSGGVAYKVPGRLGLAGCPRMGCDASNAAVTGTPNRKRKRGGQSKVKNAFAVACTGRGEHFFRSNLVGTLTRRLSKSADLERALRKSFAESSGVNGGRGVQGGVLALVSASSSGDDTTKGDEPRRVQLGAAFTTPCMGVGFLQCRADGEPKVQVQLLRRPQSARDGQDLAIHVSFLSLGTHKHE